MLVVMIAYLFAVAAGREVTRDYFGDIFRLSNCSPKNLTSQCDSSGSRLAMEVPGRPCYCQCAPSHFTYREDRKQCVKDIKECYMSVFYRPYAVESIPLVYLPTSGQLVHPEAHLSLSGRRRPAASGLPKCKATVSQYMSPEGWRTITRVGGGPVFTLFQDGNKTFLQFLGTPQDRQTLQQHLVLIRMFCKIPDYTPFETCVAIRIGWTPGLDSLVPSGVSSSRSNMMVVGLSLGVLGMIYVLAVLIYLKLRRRILFKANRHRSLENKCDGDVEDQRRDPSKRLEMYHSLSSRGKKASTSANQQDEQWKQVSVNEMFDRGWTERPGELGCEFSVKDFQLRPEHFEPEVLASPPQPVMDYLQRLQDSMTYARHRLRAYYRYQPTLNGIPEDDYYYQEKSTDIKKEIRTTPDGGSSPSNASLNDSANPKTKPMITKPLPKPPPPKPKRRPRNSPSQTSQSTSPVSSSNESQNSNNASEAEEEKTQIQSAMDTLNDTLEAIEYDIFKQDLLRKDLKTPGSTRESGTGTTTPSSFNEGKPSSQTATDEESDGKDVDSSSCSSLSVVTVLGKEPKLLSMKKLVWDASRLGFERQNALKVLGKRSKSVSPTDITRKSIPTSHGVFSSQDFAADDEESVNDNVSTISERETSVEFIQPDEKDVIKITTNGQLLPRSSCKSPDGAMVQKTSIKHVCHRREDILVAKSDTNNYDTEATENETEMTDFTDTECSCSTDKMSTLKSSVSSSTTTTTSSSDMTEDSLDSQPASLDSTVNSSALVDMWVSCMSTGSLRVCKHGKAKHKKKKSSSGESFRSTDSWNDSRQNAPCPVHDCSDNTSLIDKLAEPGAETGIGNDVYSYFQTLKQDVLLEHLRMWLTAHHSKKSRSRKRTRHVVPEVLPNGEPVLNPSMVCARQTEGGVRSPNQFQNKILQVPNVLHEKRREVKNKSKGSSDSGAVSPIKDSLSSPEPSSNSSDNVENPVTDSSK